MCGYCTEIVGVMNFLEQEIRNVAQVKDYNVDICLQESQHFPEIVSKLKHSDYFSQSITVAFCRIWEKFLFQKYDKRYQSVISDFNEQSINVFLKSIRDNFSNSTFAPLGDKNLYIDSKYWQQFISNKKQLIADSLTVLNDYHHFWILGEGRELSAPGHTTTKGWSRFYSQFPLVYFSFLFVFKYQSDANIIKKIALESPYSLPDLRAYDLWLQRKAFTVCVKKQGLQFIFDNYEKIRLELIYYSLLKNAFCTPDLQRLKNYIQANERASDGVTTDRIIELIVYLQT